jgi:hypothetical protein
MFFIINKLRKVRHLEKGCNGFRMMLFDACKITWSEGVQFLLLQIAQTRNKANK